MFVLLFKSRAVFYTIPLTARKLCSATLNYPYTHFGDFLLDVIITHLLLAGILWLNVISTHLFCSRPLAESLGLF